MAEAAAPTGFMATLSDPNFINLLAGIGAGIDPEGAGGVIGKATQQYVQSKAAQGALEKQDIARKEQIKQLIDLHGGVTAPNKPGLNSIKATPSGSYQFDLNLPPLDQPVGTGTVLAPLDTPATTPLRNAVATPAPAVPTLAAPKAPVAPAAPVVTPTTTPATIAAPTAQAPSAPAAGARRPSLDEIIPFY